MSSKIGQFEILSELAKSPTSIVYKANDPESGQTIALKAIQLSAFGEGAQALEHALIAEAEATKTLSSPNLTTVTGAGEIEGKFCAEMEYVQGNSIATMLARKEGFSIWDLLDIGRQLCNGLDYAASQKIVHNSLEPSKIMCGWDGTVKILSYGVSSVGNFVHHASEGVSSILYYMSPEQVRGETMDVRSNLFSLGAIFYEMVTERRAFDREDVESLRQSILESTPVAPAHVNAKVHPLLSDLIMKALSKDPAERYQTGRELLDDLEKCKESKPVAAKKAEPPKGTMASGPVKAAAQSKFVGASAPAPRGPVAPVKTPAPPVARVAPPAAPPVKPTPKPAAPVAAAPEKPASVAKPVSRLAMPKAAAAAAGAGSSSPAVSTPEAPEIDLSAPVTEDPVTLEVEATETSPEHMSAAAADEPQVETFEPQVAEEEAPRITVDPMMAGDAPSTSSGTSFSEIDELPPLKEVYVAPPPPPEPPAPEPVKKPAARSATVYQGRPKADDKPKVQPREVAQKAIKEIKGVPPKLMMYALTGAGILIVAIAIGMTLYIHSIGSDDDAGAARPMARAVQQSPAAQPQPSQPAPDASTPAQVVDDTQPAQPEPDVVETQPGKTSRGRYPRKRAPAPAALAPGQLAVDSTPEGAQVQVNGKSDPSWVTPLSLANLQPGQYTITVSKSGYVTDTRTVELASGNRANASFHLASMSATLIVKSDPEGASIYVDGHDVGTKTPAQVSVHSGQHVVLVRMSGYIDETMNGQFVNGQTFNFTPTLRALGNVDSIKTVGGKMSRLFGGGKADANQATITIHTQPKGAQITINRRMIDKNSPVDVAVDPGNYVIDISLTGYAPVHKVVTADRKGKIVIDEVLRPQ